MEVRCKRTLNFIIMKNHDNSCYKKDLQKPTISHISITTNDVSIEKCTCYTILPTPIHQKKKLKTKKQGVLPHRQGIRYKPCFQKI
jgi:hypothetical protein